ncbi:MAG: LptF/LptG family permease [Beijerinckiaceae bacterium]
MPRLLYLYLGKRVILTAIMIEVGLCVPVVFTSLFQHLPAAAIRGGLLWPALLGTMPTVTYIALPMAVGVAVALEFSRMASEGMIAVLYSVKLSVWAICVPAGLVGLMSVVLGYVLSSVIAPAYVGQMHDVIYIVRDSLNHRMLEPAKFYTFDKGARTLYFERWRSADVASGMFIDQISTEKNEEEIITADETEFRRNDHGVLLIMSHGSIESRPLDGAAMRTADFDEYVIPIDTMQGSHGLPHRTWRGVFELQWNEFFPLEPNGAEDPRGLSEWMSEASKRLAIPPLALTHTLFAIGLVLTLASATGRGAAATMAIVAVPVAHIAVLIGSETLVRRDPVFIWLVAAAILVEFLAAVVLIHRQHANFSVARAPQAHRA